MQTRALDNKVATGPIFSVRGFNRAADGSVTETWLRATSADDAILTARELVPRISGALALCTTVDDDTRSMTTVELASVGDVPDEHPLEQKKYESMFGN